jgi:hypothetical protein
MKTTLQLSRLFPSLPYKSEKNFGPNEIEYNKILTDISNRIIEEVNNGSDNLAKDIYEILSENIGAISANHYSSSAEVSSRVAALTGEMDKEVSKTLFRALEEDDRGVVAYNYTTNPNGESQITATIFFIRQERAWEKTTPLKF